MKEQEIYDEATKNMNEKAKYRLANFLAHDFELIGVEKHSIVKKNDRLYIITDNGDLYELDKKL